MANIKITDLTAYTDPVNTDVLPIVDVTSDVTKKVSIANVMKNASLGTAAAPGIAFDGDPNTGIYSPGADQLALSTNGTGRLFVDASGNVGVGASPAFVFDAYKASAGTVGRFMSNGTDANLSIRNSAREGILGSDNNQSYLLNSDAYPWTIWTNNTERLRITSAGLVGIGTSSPGEKLTVAGNISLNAAQPYVALIDSVWGSAATFRSGVNTLGTAPGDYQLFNVPAGKGFAFAQNNATNSLVIDSSGRVGIGTTSPSSLLTLRSDSASAATAIRLENLNASGGVTTQSVGISAVFDYNNGGSVAGAGSITFGKEGTYTTSTAEVDSYLGFATTLNNSTTEKCRITSDGKLLVGTSSDSGGALLQVNGDRIRVATAKTPASASDTGTTGEICWDASYIYVCTATNTWKRAALATW